jgi:hypothetical protein
MQLFMHLAFMQFRKLCSVSVHGSGQNGAAFLKVQVDARTVLAHTKCVKRSLSWETNSRSVNRCPAFYGARSLSLPSQQTATGPYDDSDKSIWQLHNLFLSD